MKDIKNIVISYGILACEFAAFWTWKVEGIEGAGNVLVFWLWVKFALAILTMLTVASLIGQKQAATQKPVKSSALRLALGFAMTAALVWFGHVGLGALRLAAMAASGAANLGLQKHGAA